MPVDLTNFPHWKRLVETNPRYRKAWKEGKFPPIQPVTEPSAAKKVVRYAGAVSRWVLAGKPERSQEEVARIYDTICKPCEFFKNDSCVTCGCRVRRSGAALLNKISMDTESCPKKKW